MPIMDRFPLSAVVLLRCDTRLGVNGKAWDNDYGLY